MDPTPQQSPPLPAPPPARQEPVILPTGGPIDGAARIRRLGETLDRVGRTVRTLLVVRAAAWIGAAGLGTAILLGLIDLGLRLPGAVRGVLLLGGLIAAVWGVRALVLPAWRNRPNRADLARRIETIEPRHAGQIAPAVDLLDQIDTPGPTGAMARAGVERAGERTGAVDAWKIVRWSGVGGALGALAFGLIVLAGLTAWSPAMTGIGAARVLTPWTDASWPKRFGVADLTEVEIHPADEALPVRVAVGPSDPGTRVRVEWRIGESRVSRTPMAPQPGRVDDGRPYERLIDPVGIGEGEPGVLRYRVVTPDDTTPWTRVRLVKPPEVIALDSEIEAPAHAAGAPGMASFRTGERGLDTGDAALGPVLEGSIVTLTWRFSGPVEPIETDDWSEHPLDITQPEPTSVRVVVTPDAPLRILPRVRDPFGLGVRGSVSAGIDVRADAPPGVAITEPASDEIVTPGATLPVRAEAGDDVGVTAMRLETTLWRTPEGSTGATPEPVGKPGVLATGAVDAALAKAEIDATVTPGALNAGPGDEIVLQAVASDTRGELGAARSGERRLRVVSPETLAARLRSELGPLSRLLRRADDQQGTLMDRVRAGTEETDPLVREQIALADTVASAARSVRALDRSRERNALEDAALESLLRDLDATLGEAQDAARDAARAIENDDTPTAQREQREARDRIGEALSMLDRGEDAFLARRAVARIREQLADARQQTGEIGQRTAGQDASSLSPQDRTALEQLAVDQAELADRAREALEELTRRAEALERDDPAQAEALRQAAEQGRAGAVGQLIEQASAETGENQTGEAQQTQQEAIDQLDEMLEQIDRAEALRDTALRRKLATLIASITQLVAAQRGELVALDRAGADPAALARGMIALRDNTLGVVEEASAALAELRLIAESLREAESAQVQAIARLRDAAPSLDAARVHEQTSLSALERALEEAQRQDEQAEQREQDRRKAELRKAYADALQQQSALRDEAAPLIGRSLDRRERVEARRFAATQRELAEALGVIREQTAEISEAPVFALAHDRLDDLMRAASEGLGEAAPPRGVALDQDQAVAILASLVAVLGEDTPGQQEDFQDGAAGGEGQGGEGGGQQDEGLIPPVAELRLLRDMQRAAMDMTRRMGEQPDLTTDVARVGRLSDLQRLLAERGVELIEKLNRPPGAPAAPTPSVPEGGSPPIEPAPPGLEGDTSPPTDETDANREPSTPEPGSTDEVP